MKVYKDDGSAIYDALVAAILHNERTTTQQKPTNNTLNALRLLEHHVSEKKKLSLHPVAD